MTIDLSKLRSLARAASMPWPWPGATEGIALRPDAAYVAAASPAVMLALIERLERAALEQRQRAEAAERTLTELQDIRAAERSAATKTAMELEQAHVRIAELKKALEEIQEFADPGGFASWDEVWKHLATLKKLAADDLAGASQGGAVTDDDLDRLAVSPIGWLRLIAELRAARAIVRDLAAIEPVDYYQDGSPNATCCLCDGHPTQESEGFKHRRKCPWRRANELQKI